MVMMVHHDVQTPTFDEFFLAEFPRLVSMLTAWSGDRSVAEELAQDALLQAHRNWATVVSLERPGTWVRRVRYVDDLPLADIAAVLGCSDGTVKTHLQRARRTLADHLSVGMETPR